MMQDMINGLLIVLIPMVLGYLLKVNNKSYIAKINHIVMFLLYIILFLMGYLLGQLDDLEHKLPIIGTTAVTLSAIILGSNMVGLMLYDRFNPAEPLKSQGKIDSRWHSLIDSLKLSGTVVIGTLCYEYSATVTIGFLFQYSVIKKKYKNKRVNRHFSINSFSYI